MTVARKATTLTTLLPTVSFRQLTSLSLFHARKMSSDSPVSNPLPASFLRGGTSKGVFISSAHLPADRTKWDPIFLRIMGSPDRYGRQLNGMGGGISSLSKICVVGPPGPDAPPEVDVEYTFAQIGIKDSIVDYSGNCGNLSSMIGVFALDEGLCKLQPEKESIQDGIATTTISQYNTNTRKVINTTFPVVRPASSNPVGSLDIPQVEMAGVPGLASRIVMDFLSPDGASTGRLFPTDNESDLIPVPQRSEMPGSKKILASLVDAANPSVFITESSLRECLPTKDIYQPVDYTSESVLDVLERIRLRGAEKMGLDQSAQAQPKIAVLSSPTGNDNNSLADITVRALSMGVLHKAIPMTLGLCLGVAAGVQGTVVSNLLQANHPSGTFNYPRTHIIRISHPTGIVEVGAEFESQRVVKSAKVTRTGKRLMKGVVYY